MLKIRLALLALVVLLLAAALSTMAYPPPEPPATRSPFFDLSNAPPGCQIPNGYSAACGYYASNTNGECRCRQGDTETTLCMKSNAGAGCGLFETPNDPCCQSSSGF